MNSELIRRRAVAVAVQALEPRRLFAAVADPYDQAMRDDNNPDAGQQLGTIERFDGREYWFITSGRSLDSAADVDWFEATVTTVPTRVNFDVSSINADRMRIELFREGVTEPIAVGPTGEVNAYLETPGNFYIKVTSRQTEPVDVYDFRVQNTPRLPTVGVRPGDPNASEPGSDTGSVTFYREGNINGPLTLVLDRMGDAGNGVDYESLPATVTIPAGSATTTLTVTPREDNISEGPEFVTIGINDGGYRDYLVSFEDYAAGVTIWDNDVPATDYEFAFANVGMPPSSGVSGSGMATDVVTDAAGNSYVTGHFNGSKDFDPGPGDRTLATPRHPEEEFVYTQHAFIAKYAPTGALLWAHQVGGTDFAPYGSGAALALDRDGNLVVSGGFSGTFDFDPSAAAHNLTATGEADGFFLKLTSDGQFLWARQSELGSHHIATDAAGNLVNLTTFSGTVDADPSPVGVRTLTSRGDTDVALSRFSPDGNLLWADSIGGAWDDHVTGLATDAQGNVSISGSFHGSVDFDPGAGETVLTAPDGDDDPFTGPSGGGYVASFAPSGALRWATDLGGIGATALAADAAGNVYATGGFEGTADFDRGPGQFMLTGGDVDEAEAFLLKLNASGNFVWARDFGQGNHSWGQALATDATGNVVFVGKLEGTVAFSNDLEVVGTDDLLVARFAPVDGRALSATRVGDGAAAIDAYAVTVDPAGNVLAAGRFFGMADFDPGPGTATRIAHGGLNPGDAFFLLKLGRVGFPYATLHPLVLPEPGATSMTLTVTYAAEAPINAQTVDGRDIRVLGPNNFSEPGTLVSRTSNADGTLTATYRVTPPGGTWDAGDNGVYSVALQASQIASSAGQFVTAMTLGSFKPTLPMFGDVNRDGRVNGSDFSILASNFGKTGRTWAQGDMNGDGAVNGSDFALLAANFGKSATATATTTPAASTTAAPPAAQKAPVTATPAARPVTRRAAPAAKRAKAPPDPDESPLRKPARRRLRGT